MKTLFRSRLKLLFIAIALSSLSIFIKDATPGSFAVSIAPAMMNGVQRISPTEFMITPDTMQEVYRAFGHVQAPFKAHFDKTVESNPLLLEAIPQGHVLERMGFQNGDHLESLNEKPVSSLRGLNGLFFVLSGPKDVIVRGIHAGQPFMWTYHIRQTAKSASDKTTSSSFQPLELINPFFYLSGLVHLIF